MLRHASNHNFLDNVVVGLVHRARSFSRPAQQASRDVPNIHSKIREQIMAQAHSKPRSMARTKAENNWLVQVQLSVENKDLQTALKYWLNLHQTIANDSEKGYRLHEPTEKKLGQLLVSHMQRHKAASLNSTTEAIAQKFAFESAANGFAEPLATMMFRQLQESNPQAVLDLYQKFLDTVAENKPPVNAADSQAEQESYDEEGQDFDPGRVSVLIAAITAHAMNDSFKAAFDAYMGANIRIRNYRKNKVLGQQLRLEADVRKRALEFIDRLEICALVGRPVSLSKHVMNLSHPRSARVLERLYNDILNGIDGSEPYLAATPEGLSDARLFAVTDVCWTALQTAFIKAERTDLAVKMWDDLARRGIRPGVSMWTALLDTYADLRNSRQAMITWNLMLQQKVAPDGLSYRAMIAALFDDNKAKEAIQRFQEFQRLFSTEDSTTLTVYNTVLRGLLRINMISEANMLLGIMLGKGPQPDIVSYNTFLAYYRRQGDFKGISSTITRMSEAGITGDVVTFSTILVALLAAGRHDAPDLVLSIMAKQGVKPNVATYTAIVSDLMKQHSEDALGGAIQILDKMEQSPETKPNEVTYTSILSGINRSGSWLSKERKEDVKADIVSRMRRYNITFRVPTYHVLIQSALESSDPDGYKEALALLHEMESQGVPRVNNTWYILLLGLIRLELWDVAREMVTKMYRSGHQPTSSLESLVEQIRRKDL